ncbi:hypothetical protein ACMGDK_11525 [Chryseobacterium sp. DT-3]|uniref:hypothetical protein n=1 Tax=Chryseobacterium sp. DT-3 TaxID=3396164 RepID=UPI003F1BF307
MKTKVIILTAAISVLLFSCKTDRNEDEPIQPNSFSKEEKIKINNRDETSKEGDSVVSPPPPLDSNGDVFIPDNPDNNEIIPPGDVKPPKP